LVCDSDTPFSGEQRNLLTSLAQQAAVALVHGRAVMRGVLAQEIHHRVKNNLQTVASLLRLQARSNDADPRQALEDSVNRILAIAAVHEVLTEQRDELAELVERLRVMIVQGLGADKTVNSTVQSISLPGDDATALALVFTELLQNALEHGGDHVSIGLEVSNGQVVLRVDDDGPGVGDRSGGTGLSIADALVRDELNGTLALNDREHGLSAEVAFPR
jgi:two-component sensor histidine kinase